MRTSNSDPYLVVIDPAGTSSQAKREAATQRGQTPERRRRGDEEYENMQHSGEVSLFPPRNLKPEIPSSGQDNSGA